MAAKKSTSTKRAGDRSSTSASAERDVLRARPSRIDELTAIDKEAIVV